MNTSHSHTSPLADTAAWTAAVRAMETQRQDRLFEYPHAGALAGEVGASWIAGRTAAGPATQGTPAAASRRQAGLHALDGKGGPYGSLAAARDS
jgi:O-methyltransferase involved in polyketide biosynthesis